MAGVEAMIAEAEKSIGLGESPPGSNKNVITDWYGMQDAWCNMAITYWSYRSGNQDAVCFGGKFAYTVYHAQAFKDHGQWHSDVAGIQRGDIVFFDWSGSDNINAIDHVGIVTGTGAGGAVYTIEGNFNNVCARHTRYSDTIAGYGRPNYPAPPVTVKTSKPAAGQYVPYPGAAWFHRNPNSPIVTAMGERLVTNGCSRYRIGPGPQWTDADRQSYQQWQLKCGYRGTDADGWPGKDSWDRLKVPVTK